MKRLWMSGAAAVMAISIAGVSAQTPPTQQPPTTQPPTTQPPTTQPPANPMPQTAATAQNMQTRTLQGCVYKEADVPGRTPNVAERAGVLEDYILVASNDTPAATAGRAGTTPPATAGTSGTTGMSGNKAYKLEKIDDEKLRAVVGKRVEVTGRLDAERHDTAGAAATGTAGAPARDKSLGPDQIELPEFEVTSIREVEGTCPATPNIRR
ncbi:hypothetical protein BH24ACI5_BH24ACI5_16200 [soil metagenome]